MEYMKYIEVLVADVTFHGKEALTYASESSLTPGTVVSVPIRRKQVLGVVTGPTARPAFAVKQALVAIDIPLPRELLQLLEWIRTYYPAPLGIITHLFLPGQLPKKPEAARNIGPITTLKLPPLTTDQQNALQAIGGPGTHLLHGETGSGKTRVYIELAQRSLAQGKSAVILTPEIGLTSQLAQGFRSVFGERVILVHSQLTDAVRQRNWQRILESREPLVVIGARSALFAPLRKIGLIVVDESHETAYKQDQAPYYHATAVAAKLASLHSATLVLGSATPLITDYYVANAKQRPVVRMAESAKGAVAADVNVQVVDLRDRAHFTKSPYLSSQLITEIKTALDRHEQALLFLNRRGTARVVFCENCGWQAACPHCDLPLVYHGDSHRMRCHTCEYSGESPMSCPSCRGSSIIFKSIGTKAIASEITHLFPEAKVMRFDTDNKKSERIETHYDTVRDGTVDIIVGTQTLAKGLDLPKLSLVGIIIADTSLYFPDFTASERTYQLLSQVLGRIGRGHRAGRAVIQTYAPDNPLLKAALTKDWDNFYNSEVLERRTFRFPPFCYLLKLTCKRASSKAAERAAEKLADELRRLGGLVVEGPSPAFHEKVQNKYAWQLVVKSKQRGKLLEALEQLPAGWSYDIDPMNLL